MKWILSVIREERELEGEESVTPVQGEPRYLALRWTYRKKSSVREYEAKEV